jgi:uncharacterized protein
VRWRPSRTIQVEDRRGQGGLGGLGGVRMGGLGGGGIPLPVGGGIGGIVVLIIIIVVMSLMNGGLGDSGGSGGTGGQGAAAESLDANDDFGQFVNTVTVDVQAFWEREFQARNQDYPETVTVLFSNQTQTQTGCGVASSAMGPFYCPADGKVFIDDGFFRELETRFGATGEFAPAYVIAHEYGHRVQDVLGTMDKVRSEQQSNPGQANDLSIRLELQADCYAGFWASSVWRTPDDTAVQELTQQDITDGLNAAAAVGDDRIQEQATGTIDRESWTHGSAEQRAKWFGVGFENGTLESCDTFSVASP